MKKLKLLISNDDGIQAEGIARLTRAAAQFGDVWVAAPQSQCSGMSQKLTIFGEIAVERAVFPAPVQEAWRRHAGRLRPDGDPRAAGRVYLHRNGQKSAVCISTKMLRRVISLRSIFVIPAGWWCRGAGFSLRGNRRSRAGTKCSGRR